MRRLNTLLIYPNIERVAGSNLGFALIAYLIKNEGNSFCELGYIKEDGQLISRTKIIKLINYDIIGFSVSDELDFLNIIKFFNKNKLILLSKDRSKSQLFIAGGCAVSINPEIIADVFDIIVIGEADELIGVIYNLLASHNRRNYESLLLKLNEIQGVYIPCLKGGLNHAPKTKIDAKGRVKRIYSNQITPFIHKPSSRSIFGKMNLIEVQRGCGMGCRFCISEYIYRPPRIQNENNIIKILENIKPQDNRLGLIGPNIMNTSLLPILKGYLKKVKFFLPSLRVSHFNSEWLEILKAGDQKTVTISVECRNPRLQRLINKEIKIEELFNLIQMVVKIGILNIKIYFMIGLPQESDDDIYKLVDFIKEMQNFYSSTAKKIGRIGTIIISINPFLPKPHTPLQWCKMADISILKNRYRIIKNTLAKINNLKIKLEPVFNSYFQLSINRSNRSALNILNEASIIGIKNCIRIHKDYFKEISGEILDEDKSLPWEIIDSGVKRSYLLREKKRGFEYKIQTPCDKEICRECGIC